MIVLTNIMQVSYKTCYYFLHHYLYKLFYLYHIVKYHCNYKLMYILIFKKKKKRIKLMILNKVLSKYLIVNVEKKFHCNDLMVPFMI